jgi:hypothetical protein
MILRVRSTRSLMIIFSRRCRMGRMRRKGPFMMISRILVIRRPVGRVEVIVRNRVHRHLIFCVRCYIVYRMQSRKIR